MKLPHDEPISNFAFNFNLRRYTLAADHHGITAEFKAFLYWCEVVFTLLFIAEFVVKHAAYGPVWYWTSPWNLVDGRGFHSSTFWLNLS